jgi:DNA mismatch repair ATPase MutS
VDAPEFIVHAHHVHFTEQLHDEGGRASMTFDYVLRAGPATSRNALALVRLVGLGDAR